MISKGQLYTCDRCDESIFMSDPTPKSIPTEESGINRLECTKPEYPEKWQKIFGMDLCPMCAASFKKWREYCKKVQA
ncbi:MAG: hypothetical protein LIP10_03560 [Clostridiales bacterium]|nr:hypothetical protein [Clostridiales bacterium]